MDLGSVRFFVLNAIPSPWNFQRVRIRKLNLSSNA
jgi:hypothetical protein